MIYQENLSSVAYPNLKSNQKKQGYKFKLWWKMKTLTNLNF